MALYGKREHYDAAQRMIKDGLWHVDLERGLILSAARNWQSIGSVRDDYVRVTLTADHGYKAVAAHRVIWESVHGPSDLTLTINHIDGDSKNNRIENLELVPNKDNCDHAHGTLGRGNGSRNKGEKNPQARLCRSQVRVIKRALNDGENYREIAEFYGVSPLTIHSIKRGANWKDVPAL